MNTMSPVPLKDKQVFIHVGIHKTGTTSIQRFFHSHRKALLESGVDYYRGLTSPSNHGELHAAAMRAERDSPFKRNRQITVDEDYRENVRQHVHRFVTESPAHTLVFSAEGLSYLRYQDEMERLRSLIPSSVGNICIIMYLRNGNEFLASYKHQMNKHFHKQGIAPAVEDKDSYRYTGPDTWLLDFESRLAAFRNTFGAENVVTRQFEDEVSRDGNVIPSFLRILGIEKHFREQDWNAFFRNRTEPEKKSLMYAEVMSQQAKGVE